jgi:FkbM family methyltransferase
MSLSTQFQYVRAYPQWRFAPPRVQMQRKLERFGSEYGGYYLDPSLLNAESIVYSLGIGEDLSFDLALIERFGLAVEAFDPTPKVKTWLASQGLPLALHFHDMGIASFDGKASFYLPPRKDWTSHTMVPSRYFSADTIHVPVMRLSSAMRKLGHDRIDVLKMDIEGAEFAVIEDIVAEKISIAQLVVEFHHRFAAQGTEETRRTLAALSSYGMRISYICPRMETFTLVCTQAVSAAASAGVLE